MRAEPIRILQGNIKQGVSYAFGSRLVALCYDNRRGKSSVFDAIMLGVLGKHPVGPHGSSLMELTPDEAESLNVMLQTESAQAVFRVDAPGGKAKKPPEKPDRSGWLKELEVEGFDFNDLLPSVSMRDLVKMGSTLSRESIMRRFGEGGGEVPAPRGLTAEQSAGWDAGQKSVKANPDPSVVLADMSESFRKMKLEMGREATALEKIIAEREKALAGQVAGAEDLPGLRARLETALAWERSSTARARKTELETELEAYKRRVAPLMAQTEARAAKDAVFAAEKAAKETELATLQAAIGIAQAEVVEQERLLRNGQTFTEANEIGRARAKSGEKCACVLCGSPYDPEAQAAALAPKVAARRGLAEAARRAAQTAQDAYTRAWQAFSGWQADYANAARGEQFVRDDLKREYERIKTALDEVARVLGDAPGSYVGPASVELRVRIEGLEKADTLSRALDAEIRRLRELGVKKELYAMLEQEAKRELNKLLAKVAENATAAVNKYMGDNFRAYLDLEKSRWQMVGLDGRPHGKHVMTGAEQGQLMVALACAWHENQPGYLLLDDADLGAFDPKTLREVLDALASAVEAGLICQVFVAWPRPDEIPPTWEKHTAASVPGAFVAAVGSTLTLVPDDSGRRADFTLDSVTTPTNDGSGLLL